MTLPRAELLAIGSELLEPWRIDTNGSFLARRLGERGIAVRFRTTVGDVDSDLCEAFRIALNRAEIVVATGGLGPTVDDRTREALASVLNLPLIEDPVIAADLTTRFRRYGYPMPERNRRQAQVPRGAEVLPNRLGSAPGLLLKSAGVTIALLPGVPSEMRAMTDEQLLPRLGPAAAKFVYRVLKVTGLTESDVDGRLEAIEQTAGEVGWTILASIGQVEIHLKERLIGDAGPVGIPRLEAAIEKVLGEHLFARDDESLEQVIGRRLLEAGQTVALAESITGGLVARRLTDVPGASGFFVGGLIAYGDRAKIELLGVNPETLRAHSAVSAAVAAEMAAGARRILKADWGLSTTGYAGPDGGSAATPIGTVQIGLHGPNLATTRERRLPGDRDGVRDRAARAALDLLRRACSGALR